MERAKYIVAEIVTGGVAMETPIIFPSFIAHSDIALRIDSYSRNLNKVISAGFVQFTPGKDGNCVKVVAFGESVSLKIKSRPKDARLIACSLGLVD